MTEKTIKTRIINKHAIESDWLKATNFTPMKGELIIYDPDTAYSYSRFKIGDGITNVNDLPFAADNTPKQMDAVAEGNGAVVIDDAIKDIAITISSTNTQSVSVFVSGRNLIPYPYNFERLQNDENIITDNSDGTYTITNPDGRWLTIRDNLDGSFTLIDGEDINYLQINLNTIQGLFTQDFYPSSDDREEDGLYISKCLSYNTNTGEIYFVSMNCEVGETIYPFVGLASENTTWCSPEAVTFNTIPFTVKAPSNFLVVRSAYGIRIPLEVSYAKNVNKLLNIEPNDDPEKQIALMGNVSSVVENAISNIPHPDWNQADEAKMDFIKNKPVLGALASKDKIVESDLDFEISLATEEYVDNNLATKVDKEEGKSLSTNDFTDEYKNTLDNLGDISLDDIISSNNELKITVQELADLVNAIRTQRTQLISNFTLFASNWVDGENYYSQTVNIAGITNTSLVDLRPGIAEILDMQEYGIALIAENNDGVVTVYALNGKPTRDYPMQAVITDIIVTAEEVEF